MGDSAIRIARPCSVLLAVLCIVGTHGLASRAAAEQVSEAAAREIDKVRAAAVAIAESTELGGQAKIDGLRQLAEKTTSAWATDDVVRTAGLQRIADVLYSYSFEQRDAARGLSQHVAMAALTGARLDRIPISVHARLALRVVDRIDPQGRRLEAAEAGALRKRQLALWVGFLCRVDATIDPDWDPADVPPASPVVPPDLPIMSGMPPEALKDPAQRARYEKILQEHAEAVDRYVTQREARKVQELEVPIVEKLIVRAYRETGSDIAALRSALGRLGNEEQRDGILASVQAR